MLGPKTALSTLKEFYLLVRPAGLGWARVYRELEAEGKLAHIETTSLSLGLLCVLAGSIAIYSLLFGMGYLLYGETELAAGLLLLAAVCALWIKRCWNSI